MNINTTNCNYFNKLKSVYKDKVIIGQKDGSEILNHFNKILVSEKDLDYMGQEILIQEIEFRNLNKNQCNFKIYKLEINSFSEKFYSYYRNRYQQMFNVYIYHETKSDIIFSNCTLLDLYITILKGVDEIDIINSSRNYMQYLDTLYQYDCILNI